MKRGAKEMRLASLLLPLCDQIMIKYVHTYNVKKMTKVR